MNYRKYVHCSTAIRRLSLGHKDLASGYKIANVVLKKNPL